MRSEIKEVVTLGTHPDEYHNRHISDHACNYASVLRNQCDWMSLTPRLKNTGRLYDDDRYYVHESVFALFQPTDFAQISTILTFKNLAPCVFKRTMNIRLQYSKKVKCRES